MRHMTKDAAISKIEKGKPIPDEVWEYYWETKDREVRNAIIEASDGLILKAASQYSFLGNHQDVVQSGYLGLIFAVENYHESDAKFSTYATKCIRGFMLNCINELSGLPNRNTRVNKAYALLKKDEGVSFENAVKKFKLSGEDRECLVSMLLFDNPISLDGKIVDGSESDDLILSDVIGSAEKGYGEIVRKDVDKEVSQTLYTLASKVMSFDKNPKAKAAIESVFGLGGVEQMRQKDYAKKAGVSKQVVSQKALSFIARMKRPAVKREIRKALQIPDTVKDCDVVSYLYD